jgi:hypothetical protein
VARRHADQCGQAVAAVVRRKTLYGAPTRDIHKPSSMRPIMAIRVPIMAIRVPMMAIRVPIMAIRVPIMAIKGTDNGD